MFARVFYTVVLTIVVTMAGASAADVELAQFVSHDINLTLDVPSQEATIIDKGSLIVQTGWNLFYINGSATVDMFSIGEEPVEYLVGRLDDSTDWPGGIKLDSEQLSVSGNPQIVLFEAVAAGEHEFEIKFKATFNDAAENVRFSRENVGNEVNGTILEQGAYLSPAAYYYPSGDEELSKYRLTADIPSDWRCIADGNLMSSEVTGGRRIETFENPFANDGCMFMAAPYVVKSEMIGEIEVACYFFEADTALIDGYLEATVDYINMYSELIGPYPFERFTVVENFFPTGYGMPAWTLLGQQVLRLPFIKHTSLGHEVLHNWWGNSVYVDYERGNWCEAATVYGADYRYKLNESAAAAKVYRKDILKAYVSYVNDGNDFPIREFTSRTSPGTRTIGYSKAMMVYHMIEEEIGSDPFWAAWKLVFKKYLEQKISWEEWIAAFEETSGQDLSWVIPQWIDRAGAPTLGVEFGGTTWVFGSPKPSTTVPLVLTQAGEQLYRLRVPVQFAAEDGIILDTFVVCDTERAEFEFTLAGNVSSVEIDPEYHLFRKLYPSEIEPIVSAVMGVEQKKFVAYDTDIAATKLFASFGSNISEDSAAVESPEILDGADKTYAPILLNPTEIPEPMAAMFAITDSSVAINDVEYLREGHTFVLSGKNWNGFEKYMVVLTSDYESLPRLGQLIPHYGKYSYLVFEGARNVGKGQWNVTESPLRISLDE